MALGALKCQLALSPGHLMLLWAMAGVWQPSLNQVTTP